MYHTSGYIVNKFNNQFVLCIFRNIWNILTNINQKLVERNEKQQNFGEDRIVIEAVKLGGETQID